MSSCLYAAVRKNACIRVKNAQFLPRCSPRPDAGAYLRHLIERETRALNGMERSENTDIAKLCSQQALVRELTRCTGGIEMITVSDVLDFLEGFAPSELAESWDNVGLLCGEPEN